MGHNYHKNYFHPKKSENSENKVGEPEVVTSTGETTEDFEGPRMNNPEVIEEADVLTDEEVKELNEEDVMDIAITSDGSLANGEVANCTKLNVRKEAKANSNVLCILNKGDKVTINLNESTEDFYRISTKTIEGFCMKNFIELK